MSASTLTRPQRHIARDRATQAALLGQHHAPFIHYTQQSPARWTGINHHCDARKGQYPRYADCSAFITWCLWNALYLGFHLADNVNGSAWQSGWTGTLATHGLRVPYVQNVIRGDIVLYGQAPNYEHATIVVGHDNGIPLVVSHGSEKGPFLLRYNYRSDVGQIRRYI